MTNSYSDVDITVTGASTLVSGGGITSDLPNTGILTNVYATGDITIASGAGAGNVGGLVGNLSSSGSQVTNGWASGLISGAATSAGQLFGKRSGSSTSNIVNTYFASDSGSALAAIGGGSTNLAGVSADTKADLQAMNFDPVVWSALAGYDPYLNLFSTRNGLSGVADASNGTAAAGATVDVYLSGSLFSSVTTGSDGSYSTAYYTPWGASGAPVAGLALTLNGDLSVSGAAYNDVSSSNLKLTSGVYNYTTTQSSLSGLNSSLTSVFGSALDTVQSLGGLSIHATGGFSIDSAVSQNGAVLIQAANGDLSLAASGSVSSGASGDAIILAANGGFINNNSLGGLSAAGGRWLVYSLSPAGSSNGGLTGAAYYNDAFDFGASSFTQAPNSGNRFVYAYAPSLTVTANSTSGVYNGSAQTDGYTLSGYLSTDDQTADTLTGSVGNLATPSKNAGTYTLTPTGNLTSDENYGLIYVAGTYTITPASLTASLTGAIGKTYDGGTGARIGSDNVLLGGVIGSDSVTASGAGDYADKNVGSGKAITSSSMVLAGADAAN